MISICIPIYNTNVTTLVSDLIKQATNIQVDYEIILLDDASDDENIKAVNKSLANKHVLFFENEKNMGLARTRNKLGRLATHPYILFIDSDAGMYKNDFLQDYIQKCDENNVIFGGCIYSDRCPSPEFILRWKYGKNREEGLGKYFSCFNFIIPKNIFLENQFKEDLRQYGYEDTLFGLNLKNKDIPILFIGNPLFHNGLDKSSIYLSKIRLSIENLIRIVPSLRAIDQENSIKLLKYYNLIERFYLRNLINTAFSLLKKKIESNLNSKKPYLWVLDLYKLGYLCRLKAQT